MSDGMTDEDRCRAAKQRIVAEIGANGTEDLELALEQLRLRLAEAESECKKQTARAEAYWTCIKEEMQENVVLFALLGIHKEIERGDECSTSLIRHAIEELKADRADADRRAGEAERRMEALTSKIENQERWLDDAKDAWGVSRNTSFDIVWAEALELKAKAEAQLHEHVCNLSVEPIARDHCGDANKIVETESVASVTPPARGPQYERFVSAITVCPVGSAIYAKEVTTVRLEDEGGGAYVVLDQEGRTVGITQEEWPAIADAVDELFTVIGARAARLCDGDATEAKP